MADRNNRDDLPNEWDDESRRDLDGPAADGRGGDARANDGRHDDLDNPVDNFWRTGDSGDPNDPYSVSYDFNDPRFDPNVNPHLNDDPRSNDQFRAGQDDGLGVYGAPGAPSFDEEEANRAGGEQPRKKSWRERIFSNQTARWVATGAPYHMLGEHESAGRLVQAVQEFGWSITDADDEADALITAAPFRISGYRAGNVVRGSFDPFGTTELGAPAQWQFLAFDSVEDSKRGRTYGPCFTAVPTMLHLPPLRIMPARFLTGPARGMQVFPTVDPIFDARFKLLARNGDEELEAFTRLITDEVRSVLSAGDDREEIWTIEGQLAVSTAQPHDEETLARHLEILGAMLRAVRNQG